MELLELKTSLSKMKIILYKLITILGSIKENLKKPEDIAILTEDKEYTVRK